LRIPNEYSRLEFKCLRDEQSPKDQNIFIFKKNIQQYIVTNLLKEKSIILNGKLILIFLLKEIL